MSQIQKPLNYPIITGGPGSTGPPAKRTQTPQGSPAFRDLFQEQLHRQQELTFSRHAQERTAQRNIQLSESDLGRLEQAVNTAGDKGLKDTLVLMDNTAFIVNIPNRVVVTVVDGGETENTVFTNIDGAVIV